MTDKNDPYADYPEGVHPFKNFVPRANPPKPETALAPGAALSVLDPTKLAGMTKEELIALIKRCAGYSWGVGMMTREEIGEAMMHRLAAKALDPTCREWLTAIQQWLDRERGKPVAPVALGIKDMRDVQGNITVKFIKP